MSRLLVVASLVLLSQTGLAQDKTKSMSDAALAGVTGEKFPPESLTE